MELINGEGTCQRFIDNWNSIVPRILKFAFNSTSSNVKKVLANYEEKSLLLQSKGT